jgi:hypothetical protein
MSNDEIRQRFTNEIKIRAYDDQYVDRAEEKEILQVAISMNVDLDTARMALVQACNMENYILESAVIGEMKNQLKVFAGNDGKVDETEFSLLFQTMRANVKGKITDVQVKRMIIEEMENSGLNKVKTGFFSNWYTKTKKEVGLG